ncbi:DNA repair protein XRCC1-like [Caloenas nicobarica]|uniref:DNA repair protein XRCC1-like n=1 Tax=Caloenas nicobarica TaxID=187106 RepID=UPI0032B78DD5
MAAMPELRFKRVVSVTSADPRHPAQNLLSPESGGRWRAGKAGEKRISAELELAGEGPIHSIHIGNDGSAFVEVLVGKAAGGDFQVLLPTAAFLSPNESRAGAELGRVRLFGPQSLVRGVAAGTWDRVRLVCSQPYCQTRPFGLAFVRLFSPPEDAPAGPSPPSRRLGPFRLREGGASPPRPPGALFYCRPSPSAAPPPEAPPGPSFAAAALGGQAPKAAKRRPSPKSNGKAPKRARTPGSPTRTPGSLSRTPGSLSRTPGSPTRTPGSPRSPGRTPGSPTRTPGSPRSPTRTPGSPTRTPGSLTRTPGSPTRTPGSAVLGGVVLVLSGFQNPLRSQLRAAAAELGAAYSPDWTARSTHLVAAFPRTPKAAAARSGGGFVLGPAWIWDCRRARRRLPETPYLLDGSASSGSEGEGPEEAPPTARPARKAPPPPDPVTPVTSDPPGSDSGDDNDQSDGDDPYGGSTEENSEEEEEEEPIPPLPDFFRDQSFFFHGDFPAGEGRLLRRYVVAFGGSVAPYMSDSVTHVVTAQECAPAFEEALELRPSLTFVRPHWLRLCGEQQRPLPAPPFAVRP